MNDAATFYTNRVLKDYKHRYVAMPQYLLATMREESINHTNNPITHTQKKHFVNKKAFAKI